jgi:hypothetical protein
MGAQGIFEYFVQIDAFVGNTFFGIKELDKER